MSRADRAGWAVVGVALLLRLVHALTIRDYPLFDVLTLDAESYDTWARDILGGEWSRGRPFYQAPLYAYFLAAVYAVTGGDLLAPRIANALLGTLNTALVWRIGRRNFGPAAGVAAAALCALHGTFLFEEGKVMKTTLGVTLGTTTLWLLGRARAGGIGRFAPWVLAGAAGAMTALVRENYLLFVAAAFVGALWWFRRTGPRPALGIATGAALVLFPSLFHNFRYDGEVLPITSQAGQNFYTGVHPGNPHGGYLVPDYVRRSPRFEEIDFRAEAVRRAGRELTPGQVSRYWLREGLRVLAAEPSRFPVLFVRKLGLLYHDFEIPDDEDVRFFRRYAPVLRLPGPGFGIIAVLGLVGLGWSARRRRAPPELALFVAVYTVSVALFFVFSRYRLPLVPPLAVFAGFTVTEAAAAVRRKDYRSLPGPAVAAAVVGAVVFRPLDVSYSFANSHLSLGIAWEVKERPALALEEYRRGLQLEPGNAKLLRRAARLASDAASRGAPPPDTLDLLERAAAANPSDAEVQFRLGSALGAAGRVAEAAERFERVLALGERPPGLHANLAIAYELLGRGPEAAEQARAALVRNPDDAGMKALLERVGGP